MPAFAAGENIQSRIFGTDSKNSILGKKEMGSCQKRVNNTPPAEAEFGVKRQDETIFAGYRYRDKRLQDRGL
jgi:hypothetical protein